MAVTIGLAFTAGFLLVFGLNLLYTDVRAERQRRLEEMLRRERRQLQTERARVAMQSRDLYEAAAVNATRGAIRPSLRDRIAMFFEQAGVRLQPMHCLTIGLASGAGGATAVWWLTGNAAVTAGVGALSFAAPILYVWFRRRRRIEKLLSQLPDAFDTISRSMRAGQTFSQGMLSIAEEAASPLAEEFGYCYDQEQLGMSPEAALRDLARRTGLLEVNIFVMGVIIHRQTGGNLSDLLATLAHVIRERYRVRGIIAALTAEGRMQARVLIAMPFLLLLLLSLVNPSYTGQLYARSWLLVVAGTLILAGWVWMRRIVNFRY